MTVVWHLQVGLQRRLSRYRPATRRSVAACRAHESNGRAVNGEGRQWSTHGVACHRVSFLCLGNTGVHIVVLRTHFPSCLGSKHDIYNHMCATWWVQAQPCLRTTLRSIGMTIGCTEFNTPHEVAHAVALSIHAASEFQCRWGETLLSS